MCSALVKNFRYTGDAPCAMVVQFRLGELVLPYWKLPQATEIGCFGNYHPADLVGHRASRATTAQRRHRWSGQEAGGTRCTVRCPRARRAARHFACLRLEENDMTKTDRGPDRSVRIPADKRASDGFNPFGSGPDPIGPRDNSPPKRDPGLVH